MKLMDKQYVFVPMCVLKLSFYLSIFFYDVDNNNSSLRYFHDFLSQLLPSIHLELESEIF